jgi:hypothetical protein
VFDLSYSEFLSFGREFFVNLENKRGFDLEWSSFGWILMKWGLTAVSISLRLGTLPVIVILFVSRMFAKSCKGEDKQSKQHAWVRW